MTEEVKSDPFYNVIASLLQAIKNCEATGNLEWFDRHSARIEELVKEHAPSGSGFDSGTTFDFAKSRPERLVFQTAFHHMTEGMYDGWTHHEVSVTASLVYGYEIRVSGTDRNAIKDYIGEQFNLLGAVQLQRPHNPQPDLKGQA